MMLSTRRCGSVSTWSEKTSRGDAEKRSASAPSILKRRSSMHRAPLPIGFRRRVEPREEALDRLPHFRSARQPSPFRADDADEGVAAVDGDPIVAPRSLGAVDEQGLHIRAEPVEPRIGLCETLPRLLAQRRGHRARRAWIKRDRSSIRRALIKKDE